MPAHVKFDAWTGPSSERQIIFIVTKLVHTIFRDLDSISVFSERPHSQHFLALDVQGTIELLQCIEFQ